MQPDLGRRERGNSAAMPAALSSVGFSSAEVNSERSSLLVSSANQMLVSENVDRGPSSGATASP